MSEPQKRSCGSLPDNNEADDLNSKDNGDETAPGAAAKPIPEPGIVPRATARSWFFTLMCMNIPIVGWFYMMYLAFNKKSTDRKSFAQAYLLYKLIFFITAAVIIGIACYIGLGILDQLLGYMDKL